ncbi:cation:proton antiporter [Mangrovihabitans endophyticus]|uniref:Sodium/hydrogen exchanger n=1 Tax=Mangrovihabitans endophyticus TaxID=1751298 RepID=A0A8J3FPU9_9ACTN|nr:sodium:proton antiporter [Mangrovihabitans endophyticus]GGK95590.1 sodium/hydrogen exchanger [Mangrovihabitans endophyticus]
MNGVQILLIIGVGIAVSAIAKRRGFEPGVIIVVLAAAASFLPGIPRLELDSELIMAIVIPPLLYSATRGASFSGFGANLRPIISLGVLLVLVTAGALGLVASWLVPSMGLAAFALGSVLAPPDTITTVSHGEETGLPKRVTSILTGESLVNDATALTLFSIALAAVDGQHTTVGRGVGEFFRTAFLGIGIGLLLGVLTLWIRKRLGHPTLETALVMLLPFTAFLAAEEVHASGILAVVVASFSVSVNLTLDPKHQYPGAYRTRLQEESVWPVIDFLLETFVFAYIGLQLRFVLADLAESDDPGLIRTLIAAGVLLVVAIVVRIGGVYALFGRWALSNRMTERQVARDPAFARRRQQRQERRTARGGGQPLGPPSGRETLLVGWTGMRGIITLAAAAAVPQTTSSGAPFPGRDAIQAIALVVTLGTLLIQGTTLGRLTRWLKFDVRAERAEAEQMRETGRRIAAEAATDDDPDTAFEQQRLALGRAVMQRQLDEDTARRLIEDIDLREAARHTH